MCAASRPLHPFVLWFLAIPCNHWQRPAESSQFDLWGRWKVGPVFSFFPLFPFFRHSPWAIIVPNRGERKKKHERNQKRDSLGAVDPVADFYPLCSACLRSGIGDGCSRGIICGTDSPAGMDRIGFFLCLGLAFTDFPAQKIIFQEKHLFFSKRQLTNFYLGAILLLVIK